MPVTDDAPTAVWTVGSQLVRTKPTDLSTSEMFGRSVLGWLPIMFLAYWAVVIAGQWLETARRERQRPLEAARLSAQLAQAQLQALRMQLHPHFLCNALNTIAVPVREPDTAVAVRLIAELGDVLRRLLHTASTHEIRLAEELDVTRRYLAIETVRF